MSIDSADVDPDGNIYAGHVDRIYKSTNGGNTWTVVYIVPGTPTQIRRVFCAANGYVYASAYDPSSENGLYRSIDGGASWTKVLVMDANCSVWGIDEDASGNLYAGEYSLSNAGQTQIWKSTDDGANWVQKYSFSDANQNHVHDIRVDPSNGYIYASVGDQVTTRLLRSTDAGENWANCVTAASVGQIVPIAFLGGYVYIGTDLPGGVNGIYRFQDDGSGEKTATKVYDFADDYDTAVYCAGEYGSKVFFGTWDNTKNTCILVYDGSNWTTPYTNIPLPVIFEGYWNVSRHDRNGIFYITNGGNLGIKFTP